MVAFTDACAGIGALHQSSEAARFTLTHRRLERNLRGRKTKLSCLHPPTNRTVDPFPRQQAIGSSSQLRALKATTIHLCVQTLLLSQRCFRHVLFVALVKLTLWLELGRLRQRIETATRAHTQ